MWDRIKLRTLTAEEIQTIKEKALEQFTNDAEQDSAYVRDTVEGLAEKANMSIEWWLEILSTDEDVWENLLGFDPREPAADE